MILLFMGSSSATRTRRGVDLDGCEAVADVVVVMVVAVVVVFVAGGAGRGPTRGVLICNDSEVESVGTDGVVSWRLSGIG